MGDETKRDELRRGNDDPLAAPRKPSTADAVERQPKDVAQMPRDEDELPEPERPENR
ncbi:MAG TPA: hypothetical protein VF698_05395 [Thermoanaerobaculia bacterium]|jgi:hypothetical protein